MNILIIGNGFDLAHKLPTQYTSFLNFIKFIKGFENFGGSVNDFLLGNDKYIAIDVFMKIHTEFEDLQFRNIMKDAYVWK